MSAIVVAAATGRVGLPLCRALDARGLAWVGLTRDVSRAQAQAQAQGFVPQHGRWLAADPAQNGLPNTLPRDAPAMFIASADDPKQDEIEIRLARQAADLGVQHIVKLSAQSAGLAPPVSFGKLHARVEAALAADKLPFTILRPVFFLQSLLFFSAPIKKGALPAPTGRGRVAFVDANDVAEAAAAVLARPADHAGRTYTLTGARAHTFGDVAAALSQRLSRRVRHISPPAFVARIALPLGTGMPRWQAGLVVDLLQALGQGAQSTPSDTVRQLTGREPTELDDFLTTHIDAFR